MEPVAVLEGELRIKLPAHALFVGASMSGKTRLATRLLSEPSLFHPEPKTILFYYDQFQDSYTETKERLAKRGIEMQLRRGHSLDLDSLPHFESQAILLIDDASEETAASKEIARIATNGRHKNISLWLIWHSLFTKHPNSRIISQNMGLYFFLPSLRLESQLRSLGSQLGMQRRLLEAYRQCTQEMDSSTEHRFLMLDLTPNIPTQLRLRSQIHMPVQLCFD